MAGSVLAVGGGVPVEGDGTYTQQDVVLLVVYILLALIFSFLCSIAEAVLLSITPSFIAGLQVVRPRRARLLRRLKEENVDRSLAAILTLNTIAHTVGAIGSGAKATVVFGNAYFGIFSAVMTLLILFLSEIIPKTLGAVHWRSLAAVTARFVQLLIWVLYPLIFLSEQLTKVFARGKGAHTTSRDEFLAMTSVVEKSGEIKAGESRIIQNLFRFDSLVAADVMTPRTVMHSLEEDQSVGETVADVENTPFSRFPIYTANHDEVSGFVLKNDVLLEAARDRHETPLANLRRDLETVPATMPLSTLLGHLLDRRAQIARVVDEYGGTAGLVSMEDVVETLLGEEIVDEADTIKDLQALARRRWRERAEKLGLAIEPMEIDAATDLEVATDPDAMTNPDAATDPDATTDRGAATDPDATTNPDATNGAEGDQDPKWAR